MTKEQIIEIAQWVINNRFPKSENDKVSDFEMYQHILDAISSLPLGVPSEEEINEYAQKEVDRQRSGFVAMNNEMPITLNVWLNTLKHSKRITAKWAINEILKRNGIQESEEK